jgi:hypothetical protein
MQCRIEGHAARLALNELTRIDSSVSVNSESTWEVEVFWFASGCESFVL